MEFTLGLCDLEVVSAGIDDIATWSVGTAAIEQVGNTATSKALAQLMNVFNSNPHLGGVFLYAIT